MLLNEFNKESRIERDEVNEQVPECQLSSDGNEFVPINPLGQRQIESSFAAQASDLR